MKKPFIKLFHVNNKYYFYDVNCNKIVEISNESYSLLAKVLQEDEFDINELNGECKKCFNAGLLRSNQITEIKNNCNNVMEVINSSLSSLLLQVTRNCNLRCKYCFYSGMYNGIRCHEQKDMDWETCKTCVDFFMLRAKSIGTVNVGFYGGEPLLNFKLIKNCVEYITVNYPQNNIKYSITTNAVLLVPSVLEFLISNNFMITISVDGPKTIHDSNRIFPNGEGSYSVVRKNIEYIHNHYPQFFKTNIRYNAVVTQDSEDVEYFFSHDKVFKELVGKLSPLNMYHENLLQNYEKKGLSKNQTSKLRTYVNYLKSFSSNPRISKLLEKLEMSSLEPLKTAIASGVCVPGASRLFVTVKGNFYMCEKVNDDSDEYKIGDVHNGWNEANILKLANISNKSDKYGCKGCWAIRLCNMCAAKICAMDELRLNSKCEEIRKSTEEDLKTICFLNK